LNGTCLIYVYDDFIQTRAFEKLLLCKRWITSKNI